MRISFCILEYLHFLSDFRSRGLYEEIVSNLRKNEQTNYNNVFNSFNFLQSINKTRQFKSDEPTFKDTGCN
jgi:hypothetical protein